MPKHSRKNVKKSMKNVYGFWFFKRRNKFILLKFKRKGLISRLNTESLNNFKVQVQASEKC